ncbi:hypothetical protein EV137_8017 [Kribbella pratensis]|uniref:Lipoprotein n=1 Tax=Kribbella pratensis TaxID=2512112 RepID=A0ABY2F435_9ACTN|nr:hypothetical protein [Kribbella pratensis]TDW79677.1 hypothetical protein EV137_8017 [Kribbella pratensis]
MRRNGPAVAVAVIAALLGVTACGTADGTSAVAAQTPATKHSALSGTTDKSAKSTLAGLVALPRGYVADPRNVTGPFTASSYLNTWSADPALDRALLLNASFVEGYRATRLSPDKKKRYTVQLFKTGSAAKAKALQKGLWNQDVHDHPFTIPNALSDARVEYDGSTDQTVALAEASLAVGPIVVELTVREVSALGTHLTPDTTLITALAKEQHTRLTTTSS